MGNFSCSSIKGYMKYSCTLMAEQTSQQKYLVVSKKLWAGKTHRLTIFQQEVKKKSQKKSSEIILNFLMYYRIMKNMRKVMSLFIKMKHEMIFINNY